MAAAGGGTAAGCWPPWLAFAVIIALWEVASLTRLLPDFLRQSTALEAADAGLEG